MLIQVYLKVPTQILVSINLIIMKLNLTFLYLLFITNLIAQPLTLEFKEANPLWRYQLNYDNLRDKEGNLVDGNLNTDEPFSLTKDSFMINISRTFTKDFILDGFIIIKTNIYTGKQEWKDVYNYYNGSDGYFSSAFDPRFDKNGNIEIFGTRKIVDQASATYPMSFRRVYDYQTGQVLFFEYDPQNKVQIPFRNGVAFVPIKKDSIFINFYMEQFGYPDTTRFRMVGALFNQKLDSLVNPFIFDIEYEPEFPINSFSLQSFFFRNVNDSITVAYATFREGVSFLYKTSSKLIFINHKDINNIYVMKVKDLESVVPFNLLYPRNIEIEIRNEEILLMDFDVVFPGPDAKPWIWRMDASGNDIQFLYDLQVETSNYNNAYLLSNNDSLTYLLCYPSFKSSKGFDIISYDNINEATKYLASVTLNTDDSKQNYFNARGSHFLIHDSILVYNGLFRDDGNFRNGARWLMTFNLNELKRGSVVGTENDLKDLSKEFVIYPNPSIGYFTFNIPSSFIGSNVLIDLYDLKGSKVWSKYLDIFDKEVPLDISNINSGIYFGVLKNNENKIITFKIVKN